MKMGEAGRTVNIGVIGLGGRGRGQLRTLAEMPDVCVKAVCDVYPDRVEQGQEIVNIAQNHKPDGYADYNELLAREDIEAVVIMTDWCTHIQIAVAAMNAGKRPAMEVGGASSIEECWDMVRTSEQTGIPLMLLENCCYGKAEMAILNMVKQQLFGELVHCAGGYHHDLREEIGEGDINRHYRLRNFLNRNGELYPTHELGPIAEYLGLNRGNRMLSLTAMASKGAGQQAWMREHRSSEWHDVRFEEGDIVITLIKCAHGELIELTHDCTLPRGYSRGGKVQGTKGIWQEDGASIYIEGRTPHDPTFWTHRCEPDEKYMEEFKHPLWQAYEQFGPRGGHDGMDYLALRGFIESVQSGTQPPIDVYDAAAWMSITCLSEQSIAMGSQSVPAPDFTNGKWLQRQAMPKSIYSLDAIHTDMFE